MQRKSLMERIINSADLPDEPLPGQPLVEIAGERRVLIENHYGVTEYSPQTIRVKVKFGQVCVCGSGLALARMTKGQLIISGKVDSVHLFKGGCR